ncbi:MAG: DUF4332 domain-containing protein, partial [Planctomycetota bacterium]
FFLFAWYPALLVLDGLVRRKRGRSLLVDRPLAFLSLLCWSLPFWLLFEALNLRVENWYYVNTPPDPVLSRLFLAFSFATVLPGLIELFDLFGAHGLFAATRSRPFRTSGSHRRNMVAAGALMLLLPLVWPDFFFPLIWGFLVLLLEPFNRRAGWPSLLRDLEKGRPGRLLRLLSAGLVCGLYWELMNMPARAHWIYTVPFFERTFGVEMPPLGFLGFAPFALEAYASLRALEILGLSVPFEPPPGTAASRMHRVARAIPAPVRLLALPGLIALGCLATIFALERRTVDSTIASVERLESANLREAAILAISGLSDLRDLLLAGEEEGGVERLAGLLVTPRARVERILEEARLIELSGLGAANARLLGRLGIKSVADLARQESGSLLQRLNRIAPSGKLLLERRIKVWIRAAREQVGSG